MTLQLNSTAWKTFSKYKKIKLWFRNQSYADVKKQTNTRYFEEPINVTLK